MHWSFVAIATLVKTNLGEKGLINILMNISSKALRDYLECVKIYKGAPSKKKTDLVEIIVYGHIDKINKIGVEDISKKEANQILRQNKILVKSLPGYGNIGLKKKEIVTCANTECSIKINDWFYKKKDNTCINSFIQNKKCDKKNNANNLNMH